MIRRTTAADLPVLVRLHGECFAQGWTTEAFGRLLASPRTFALLAQTDDVPAGFVLFRIAADEAEILSLGVRPGSRRASLGRALVLAAALQAFDEGVHTIFLEVAADNMAASALYAALGFSAAGRRKAYYREPDWPATDALTLKAALPLAGELGNGKGLD